MFDYLTAVCDSCGHTVKVSVEHGGRRAKCPKCEGVIEIPKSGDTSVRLRSDRELTQQARAKMGRGAESDSERPAGRSAGRHPTAKLRRPPAPGAARRTALIVTLIATAAVVIGIAVILLRGSGSAPPPPPPPARKPAPPAPAPAPAPPVDPHAQDKEDLRDRVKEYVRVLNEKNDLTKIAEFYHPTDLDKLRRSFGILGFDDKLTYENVQAKMIEFPAGEDATVTIAFTRVLTSGSKDEKSEAQRVLKWRKVDGKAWLITSQPEP